MEGPGVQQSAQEISLIDILWRQDIDLGVEREAFDVHFQERGEDAQRARAQEEERRKRESELERVMFALRNMDKETGEILPQTFQEADSTSFDPCIELMSEAFLSEQGSPITQNPLLSALLFSEKPPVEKEKASIELLAFPDLQHYLDVLEAHVPESPHGFQGKTTDNYNHQLHRLLADNTVIDTVSVPHVLAETHSGCAEIMETAKYTDSDSAEAPHPLPQIPPEKPFSDSEDFTESILSEAPEMEQPFLDTEDFTESILPEVSEIEQPFLDTEVFTESILPEVSEIEQPFLDTEVFTESILPEASEMEQPFLDTEDFTESVLPEASEMEQPFLDTEDFTESILPEASEMEQPFLDTEDFTESILPKAPEMEQPFLDTEDFTESILPEASEMEQPFLDTGDFTESVLPEASEMEQPFLDTGDFTESILPKATEMEQPFLDTEDFTESILPKATEMEQPFPATEDFTESFLDTIMSTSPAENLDQRSFELNSSLHTQEELYPELENSIAPEHSQCHCESVHEDSSDVTYDMTLFSLESFSEPVDLDPSLYGDDPFNTSQSEAEEAGCSQTNHTELFNLSLLSEVVDLQPPLLSLSQTNSQHLTQDKTLLNGPSEADITTRPLCETTTNTQPSQGQRSWSICRDEERARTLHLPLSVEDIISMTVDAFNEAISTYQLNESQLSLMRDIRRRGKNKMAAQSCRKRKLDSLVDLEGEVEELREEREQGIREKESNLRALRETRAKLSKLYGEVFSQLRDEHGNPYSTKEYTLQYSNDGRFFILPRSPHASKHA